MRVSRLESSARGDQAALGTLLAAREPADRRANLGIAELELRGTQPRLRGCDVRLADLEGRHCRVPLALTDRALLEQGHEAVAVASRLVTLRDRDSELGASLRRGGTERLRVDAEQDLALADPLALLVAGARAGSR